MFAIVASVLGAALCVAIMFYLVSTNNTNDPNKVVSTATALAVLEPVDEDKPSDHPAMHNFNAELRAWLNEDPETYRNTSRPLRIKYRPQKPRR